MSVWNSGRSGWLTVVIALLAAAPSCGAPPDQDDATEVAVSASTGVTSKAVSFSDMNFYVGGVLRAQLRNGVATWFKDIDGSEWVSVTSQIRDHSTDGYCAKVRYLAEDEYYGTECNAVWTTRTGTVNYIHGVDQRVEVILYRDLRDKNRYDGTGNEYRAVLPPPGY